VSVADVLRGLSPVDPPPSIADLGGEQAIVSQLADLDEALLPSLAETLRDDWPDVAGKTEIVIALADRLKDVRGALSCASIVDALTVFLVNLDDVAIGRQVSDALLAMMAASVRENASDEAALRAGHALRAATDLALLVPATGEYQLFAALDRLDDVPEPMAPALARAAGRLWDHRDEDLLRRLLEETVLPHRGAAGDASVELGLARLRTAMRTDDPQEARTALGEAVRWMQRARQADEDRPDARAFQAAAEAVLAFADDTPAQALDEQLEALAEARRELDVYRARLREAFGPVRPLASIAAWHVLASDLRALRAHLAAPDLLEGLRPALGALADAYYGMRLAVLDVTELGLQAFIRPVLVEAVRSDAALARGLEQFLANDEASEEAKQAAVELARESGDAGPKGPATCPAARPRRHLRLRREAS
jgi:hypothetical protein